jgi:hypothetical protein
MKEKPRTYKFEARQKYNFDILANVEVVLCFECINELAVILKDTLQL